MSLLYARVRFSTIVKLKSDTVTKILSMLTTIKNLRGLKHPRSLSNKEVGKTSQSHSSGKSYASVSDQYRPTEF